VDEALRTGLERLRPTWSEAGPKLDRLLRVSRFLLPGTCLGFLAILVALWEYPPIRVVMIAFIAVTPVLLLQVFFWYLPRLRDIHRLTFDEWRERIVMLRSGRPFVTPNGIVAAAFAVLSIALLLAAFIQLFSTDANSIRHAVYPLFAGSLLAQAIFLFITLPAMQREEAALASRSFRRRQVIAAAVTTIAGVLLGIFSL